MPSHTIRDFVDVVAQPTVVRLDDLQGPDSGWIRDRFYLTFEIQNHLAALSALLEKTEGCGVLLVGHYGSGKSHFLAYLTQQVERGAIGGVPRRVVPLSLLNYRGAQSLESIVSRTLQLPGEEPDRREDWKSVAAAHTDGLVLVIDELSEFLRSKPSPHAFTEDLRFLQFMGEWAQDHPFWIVGALQEQIEHTGVLEYDLYRKIKDRYPVRLLLSPAHVKDLVAQRILRKKEGYREAVETLVAECIRMYPDAAEQLAGMTDCYPLHPATLELLEEVRDRFSQARGIVEFTLTQLLGSEARGIAPFLDREWGSVLAPDAIVDHFADLLEIQPEFLALAQKVFPFYRKNMPGLFPSKAQQDLAWRLLKLLVLIHLSPRREALSVEDASRWLVFKVSTVDPGKNLEIVRRTLDTAAQRGAFVKRSAGGYALNLRDDSRERLDQLLAGSLEETRLLGDAAFEALVPLLEGAEFNPTAFPRDRWFPHRLRWFFHDREVQAYVGGGAPSPPEGIGLQLGLPWGPTPEAAGCYMVIPSRLELTPEVMELAALRRLEERPLPAPVLKRVRERIESRRQWFSSLVRAAYLNASVLDAMGAKTVPPLNAVRGSHGLWLNTFGEWALRQTYPSFERFAPSHGPLPREACRQFMKFATEHDIGAAGAPEFVSLIREGYLVPMGLLQRKGPEYVMPRLDAHELVRLVLPLIEHQPTPARVYQFLAAPVYGLVPDQIYLLLALLMIRGDIDILKGDHSLRDYYETLPNPLQYDRIVPARALDAAQLKELNILCEQFRTGVPRQWTALTERKAVEHLRKVGRRQRDQLSQFLLLLKQHEGTEELAARVTALIQHWLALEKGDSEFQAFRQFTFEIGSARRFALESEEIAALAPGFEAQIRERQRFAHLFSSDVFAACPDPDISARYASVQRPESPAHPDRLASWLENARTFYDAYQAWYRNQHAQHLGSAAGHPAWSYAIPAVARSRHAGAADAARQAEQAQSKARAARCPGLTSLEFQPWCRCGFDGRSSPLIEDLRRFEEAVRTLEEQMASFFRQEKVRKRVEEWVSGGLESNPGTLAYLDGRASYPEVSNLELFDRHLAGIDVVEEVDGDALLDAVEGQVWDKTALVRALAARVESCGPRLKIRRTPPESRAELAVWCFEQALRTGTALPSALSASEKTSAAAAVRPDWISLAALERLDKLRLGEQGIRRVLDMLLDGIVPRPVQRPASGPVAAALCLADQEKADSIEALGELAANLYDQHPILVRLRPAPWLAYLDEIAINGPEETPRLDSLLANCTDAQWIVLDCLGLPLLGTVERGLTAWLPHWRIEAVRFGKTSASTTTGFYDMLLNAGIRKSFDKVDAVDAMMHERKLDFGSLLKLAAAELDVAFRRLASKLDSTKPLVVFADHGFRLSPDGSGFVHGGASFLERTVPVLSLRG